MEHLIQIFALDKVLYAAIGSLLLWAKFGGTELTVYGLGSLWKLVPCSPNTRRILEMLTFVGLGVIVSVGVTNPSNIPQAFTAGLGWTGLVAKVKDHTPTRRRRTRN